MEKLVSFSSDGPAVMTGAHKGVGVQLKGENPRLVHVVCMAHKVALVLSNIFKTEPQLVEYDKLLSAIYNYFGKSSDRRRELERVAEELGFKKLQVLRKHDIRWMSRSEVVAWVRRIYRTLLDFFKAETAANGREIYKQLCEARTLLLTCVLERLLAMYDAITLELQKRSTSFLVVKRMVDGLCSRAESWFTYHTGEDGKERAPQLTPDINSLITELSSLDGVWHGHKLTTPSGDWQFFSYDVFEQKDAINRISQLIIADTRARFPREVGVLSAFQIFLPGNMRNAKNVYTFGATAATRWGVGYWWTYTRSPWRTCAS